MLTLPPVRSDRSVIGANVSTIADRRTPVASFGQAAKAHRVTSAMVNVMIEELPVGLLMMDSDGEVLFANAAARELGTDTVASLQGLAARALRNGRVVSEMVIVGSQAARTRLDSRRTLSVRAVPVRNGGASAHAVVVSVDDITAQARANAWEPAIASLMSL